MGITRKEWETLTYGQRKWLNRYLSFLLFKQWIHFHTPPFTLWGTALAFYLYFKYCNFYDYIALSGALSFAVIADTVYEVGIRKRV